VPSASWLGRDAQRAEITESGLWNVDHINDRYEPEFLQQLAEHVKRQQ
jgi:hypothetical protein